MPADKDDRKIAVELGQPFLQLEPAHARHAHVAYQAAGLPGLEGVEEGRCVRIGPCRQRYRAEQQRQAFPHGLIVVDDMDDAFLAVF